MSQRKIKAIQPGDLGKINEALKIVRQLARDQKKPAAARRHPVKGFGAMAKGRPQFEDGGDVDGGPGATGNGGDPNSGDTGADPNSGDTGADPNGGDTDGTDADAAPNATDSDLPAPDAEPVQGVMPEPSLTEFDAPDLVISRRSATEPAPEEGPVGTGAAPGPSGVGFGGTFGGSQMEGADTPDGVDGKGFGAGQNPTGAGSAQPGSAAAGPGAGPSAVGTGSSPSSMGGASPSQGDDSGQSTAPGKGGAGTGSGGFSGSTGFGGVASSPGATGTGLANIGTATNDAAAETGTAEAPAATARSNRMGFAPAGWTSYAGPWADKTSANSSMGAVAGTQQAFNSYMPGMTQAGIAGFLGNFAGREAPQASAPQGINWGAYNPNDKGQPAVGAAQFRGGRANAFANRMGISSAYTTDPATGKHSISPGMAAFLASGPVKNATIANISEELRANPSVRGGYGTTIGAAIDPFATPEHVAAVVTKDFERPDPVAAAKHAAAVAAKARAAYNDIDETSGAYYSAARSNDPAVTGLHYGATPGFTGVGYNPAISDPAARAAAAIGSGPVGSMQNSNAPASSSTGATGFGDFGEMQGAPYGAPIGTAPAAAPAKAGFTGPLADRLPGAPAVSELSKEGEYASKAFGKAASVALGAAIPGLGLASLASGLLGGPTIGSLAQAWAAKQDPVANYNAAAAIQGSFNGPQDGAVIQQIAAQQAEKEKQTAEPASVAAESGITPAQMALAANEAARAKRNPTYYAPKIVSMGLVPPTFQGNPSVVRAIYAQNGLPSPV